MDKIWSQIRISTGLLSYGAQWVGVALTEGCFLLLYLKTEAKSVLKHRTPLKIDNRLSPKEEGTRRRMVHQISTPVWDLGINGIAF